MIYDIKSHLRAATSPAEAGALPSHPHWVYLGDELHIPVILQSTHMFAKYSELNGTVSHTIRSL